MACARAMVEGGSIFLLAKGSFLPFSSCARPALSRQPGQACCRAAARTADDQPFQRATPARLAPALRDLGHRSWLLPCEKGWILPFSARGAIASYFGVPHAVRALAARLHVTAACLGTCAASIGDLRRTGEGLGLARTRQRDVAIMMILLPYTLQPAVLWGLRAG